MKKIITLAGSIALLAAAVIPAIAAGNNCENSTTGAMSTNYCNVNNTSSVKVENINDALIKNDVKATSNTGGNSASYNTLGGTVHTGNSSLNASVSSVANVNTTTISGGPSASNNNGLNEITGPYSDNRININNVRALNVENSNTARVDNKVETESNTGDNNADYNTGPASITTEIQLSEPL
jgi:hypothetical protein